MSTADAAGGGARHHTAGPAPHEIDVDQIVDVDGLHELRSTIAAHARHIGARAAELDALVIIGSELAK